MLVRPIAVLVMSFSSFALGATSTATQATTAPVPLLSPENEAKTFNLPAGFRAEVVASEPMVEHPVAMAFDPDGRLFVAEMRGYMPDTEGWREEAPTGRVSILEDSDGDGRMDKSTVFLDKLVLPRAVGFAGDGVLVGTPPKLLWCHDRDGNGKADSTQVIAEDFGVVENPENSANGLLYNLDNWIYNANYLKRIRFFGGKFEFEAVPDMGQFGIARDDFGRMFFNTNSDHLRGTMVPPHYSSRNSRSPMTLTNFQVAKDQTVWPANAATVNRGYREGFLRDDGTLKEFTAACAPVIFRSSLFGEEFVGNAFVCEATSNLVHRSVITEKDALLGAKSAYDKREFIASTYERFRPVNLNVGPDGALYVVDMHHGLIQHKMSITQYAKDNYKKKQLNKHLRTGRIFRIVPESAKPQAAMPRLSKAPTVILVEQLTHPIGWWRDTAQRLLVERGSAESLEPLRAMARTAKDPVHRVTALWTLDGMKLLDEATLLDALADADGKVRANAVRLCEGRKMQDVLRKMILDADPDVRLQLVLTLAAEKQDDVVANILLMAGDDYKLREAAVSGIAGREISFLKWMLDDLDWASNTALRRDVITDVARSVTRRDEPAEMLSLVEFIGELGEGQEWQQLALLEAIPNARKDDFGSSKLIEVAKPPAALEKLAASKVKGVSDRVGKVSALFQWPGKPTPPKAPVPLLTAKQQELFEVGRQQFAAVCAQCHQVDGMGLDGKAPPLRGSPWLLGPSARVVRIVLHGMRGPVEVQGKTWNLEMAALGSMNDQQIAGVLTFLRRSWGHEASPIEPAIVAGIRDWTQARRDGWTVKELIEIK